MAPRSGDIRGDLVREAAEFLGLPVPIAWQRLHGAGERFREEWVKSVADPTDPDALTRFYNQSDTELFELIEWHASDQIHYRTLIVKDFALSRPGRAYLDYGSGIGSDALVFAHAGFDVTLADISDVLLAFAAFRCRRRGFTVRTLDLKKQELPRAAFDVALCLDVLEHIPRPLPVIRGVHQALRDHGLLVLHAPFGEDEAHPMHVVHRDVVTPRMRSIGFQPVDCHFPPAVRAPRLYLKEPVPAFDRFAYFVYDGYMRNPLGDRLAAWYRRAFPQCSLPVRQADRRLS
jgi:2-polyprenyl-3-methyl-5-hydroxy-6-metoxy-1,4-benzoquinol methylase